MRKIFYLGLLVVAAMAGMYGAHREMHQVPSENSKAFMFMAVARTPDGTYVAETLPEYSPGPENISRADREWREELVFDLAPSEVIQAEEALNEELKGQQENINPYRFQLEEQTGQKVFYLERFGNGSDRSWYKVVDGKVVPVRYCPRGRVVAAMAFLYGGAASLAWTAIIIPLSLLQLLIVHIRNRQCSGATRNEDQGARDD